MPQSTAGSHQPMTTMKNLVSMHFRIYRALAILGLVLVVLLPSSTHAQQQQQQQQQQQDLQAELQEDPLAEAAVFQSLVIDGFVDTESCYSAMESSVTEAWDSGLLTPGDRRMNAETYVLFVQDYGPDGFLTDASDFADLPLILKSNFNILACLCQSEPDDKSCCVGDRAGIETAGSFADETPTPTEKSYLFLVCSLTSVSIDRVLSSSPPSAQPSISPAPTSLPTLTDAPTVAPTFAPTSIVEPVTVVVTYDIGVRGNATLDDYEQALVDAMNSLAPEVLSEVDVSGGRRRLDKRRQLLRSLERQRRRLRSVQLDTSIVDVADRECPAEANPGDRCETVTASVVLLFQPDEPNSEGVTAAFTEDLDSAIAAGELQGFLDSPDVYILDDTLGGPTDAPSTDSNETISGGAIGGIVVASLAAVGVAAYLVVGRRGQPKEELEELHPAPRDLELDQGGDGDDDPATVKVNSASVKAVGTVGVKSAKIDYTEPIKGSSGAGADDMSNVDDDGGSSNAGSSGWSSSAGLSSLNTGSQDGLDPFEKPSIGGIGSTLQALNEADASSPDAYTFPSVSRADLDNAIEAGDWAAVGATAALLAAASDSQSYTSHSEQMTGTRSQSGSSVSSLDAARAAELDHLVDAGDWEGVVLAAAKYEGDESDGDGNKSLPSESVSASESRSNTDTAGQTADASVGSSKALKQQEYRAIVVDLVQRVVPEEIQNVDEMMLQFRGREDELVETLRTMQERAVAQKARHSSQRAAKQQAKMAAKTSKSIGTGQVSAQATAKSLGTGQLETSAKSKSLGTGTIEESEKTPRSKSALEDAIERGDWDAVGDAAAVLADTSSSVGTDEIDRLAEGISTDGSSVAGQSAAAAELEELIEAGDWTGIVQAASTNRGNDDEDKKDETEARRQRRMKHLQEEQEALAQAEIWSAIAEHSLSGSDTAHQGAAEAADWAISRSLNALVEAEQSGALDRSEGTGSLPGSVAEKSDDEGNEV